MLLRIRIHAFLILRTETKTGEGTTKEIVTPKQYQNYITAIPFFNNFGGKAHCRATWEETPAGELPVKVMTLSPDGNDSILALFRFIDKRQLEATAGWREKEVLNKAKTFEIKHVKGRGEVLYLYTEDDGVTSSAAIELSTYRWVD